VQTPVILAAAVKTPAPRQGNFKEISYLKVEVFQCNFSELSPLLIKYTSFDACLNDVF
jgi:hypothetical protein